MRKLLDDPYFPCWRLRGEISVSKSFLGEVFRGRFSSLWHTAFKMAHHAHRCPQNRFRPPPKKVPATVIWGELFGGWWKLDTDGSPKNPGPFGKNVTFRTSRNYQFEIISLYSSFTASLFQVNHWLSFGECVGKKCWPFFCVSLLLTNVESNLGISGSFMIIY